MEEEIIEETFEYDNLKYVLDDEGYVLHAIIGGEIDCDLGESIDYDGEVPENYETIADWLDGELDRLNAWKIVDGNLTFDNARYKDIEEQRKLAEIDNSPVTHKELYGLKKELESIEELNTTQYTKETSQGKVLGLENVKRVIPSIEISEIPSYLEEVDIILNKNNMLPNNGVSETINGLEITRNEDKSITLNGTAQNTIEYNLAGDSNNTIPLFVLKKGIDYCLSIGDLNLKLYNYDGTDRTLLGESDGGVITPDEDMVVTNATIEIPNGSNFENVDIFPMLNLGPEAKEYEEYEVEKLTLNFIDLWNEYVDEHGTNPTIDYILANVNGNFISFNSQEEEIETDNKLILNSGFNTLYCIQDVNLNVEYCINNLALEGTATKHNNFKVLEDGSIEAHNGYFSGELNASTGNIGGFNLGTDRFTSNIIPSKDFTMDDINKVQQYIVGTGTLTDEEKVLYDLNEDGVVNLKDLTLIQSIILANISSEKPGTLEINSKSPIKTFSLKDGDGNEKVNIGLLGADFPRLSIAGTNIMDIIKGQNVLWGADRTSGWFMNAQQRADLSEKVSDQKHGIVLVFCYYNGASDTNYEWQSFFIPKELVAMDSSGHGFLLKRGCFTRIGAKYLYIGDQSISGNADNEKTGTANGITFANNKFVLRFVIGV